jgi:uncharacterized membrane protein YccC
MTAARSPFWSTVTRLDASQLHPAMAVRNALGVGLALLAGLLLHNPAGGVLGASGALNVAFSDGSDPYLHRARRMLAAALCVSLAVFTGRFYGHTHVLAIPLEAACAFLAGLMVAAGQTPSDIAAITLVTLLVFSASPAPLGRALTSGWLALGGGLLETALALAFWPVHRYAPESRAVGALYSELAHSAAAGVPASEAPPATGGVVSARAALANIATHRSLEAERYLALLSQAERIRLCLLALSRFRTRLAREPGGGPDAALIERALGLATRMLASIGTSLAAGAIGQAHPECLAQLDHLSARLRVPPTAGVPSAVAATRIDARWQLDALAGQLRSAIELAAHASRAGLAEFDRAEAAQPAPLRLSGTFAVLRANLTLGSAACRHGIRLAVCVALADVLSRSLGWHRAYWAPMTVAIVLKSDFTTTFSRGVLRLAGTFTGLALATSLVHLLSPSQAVQAGLITLFMLLMRWIGGANYGLLVTCLTGLVVFLFSLGGTPPGEVIAARALNTIAGGAIALAAYRLWPTWERGLIGQSLARLFDAYRDYFQAVRDAYLHPGWEQQPEFAERLAVVRQSGRLARTNLEASVARFANEPGADPVRLTTLDAILANSHRFIHAAMALEAGLYRSRPVPPREAFGAFANAVDATLYFLSAYLRGTHAEPGDLPDLRDLHHALVSCGDSRVERYALVNIETDRVTNSVNTLALEVLHWVGDWSVGPAS